MLSSFYFNRHRDESVLSQYIEHLQKQEYASQIVDAVQESIRLNSNTIVKEAENNREALFEAANLITQEITQGLSEVNDNLVKIDLSINHGLNLIAEKLDITNFYLENIIEILKIPDSQKQRGYFITQGLKYLNTAIKEGAHSDFYIDAFEQFEKAVGIESKDFFSLYRLGLIYLSSTKVGINPKEAEKLFRLSARYYLVEVEFRDAGVSKHIIPQMEGFRRETSNAYLFAAHSCFLQEKNTEAIELASSSWETDLSNLKAGFYYSKYSAIEDNVDNAKSASEKIIIANSSYWDAVNNDPDLSSKEEINKNLEKLRVEACTIATNTIGECERSMIRNSQTLEVLNFIRDIAKKETYFNAILAQQLLDKELEWDKIETVVISSPNQILNKFRELLPKFNVVNFIKIEQFTFYAIPYVKNLIEIEKLRTEQAKLSQKVYSEEQIRENDSFVIKLVSIGVVIGPFILLWFKSIKGDEEISFLARIIGFLGYYCGIVGYLYVLMLAIIAIRSYFNLSALKSEIQREIAILDNKIMPLLSENDKLEAHLSPTVAQLLL